MSWRRTMPMSDDRFREMAIGHLLRELDGAEESAFAAELMRRGEPGHAILREIQEPLGDLALAVAPAEPPASLRARVLADAAPAPPPETPTARRRTPWPWLAVLILAAAVLIVGVWAARLVDERDRLRASAGRLEDRISAAESAMARMRALEEDLGLVRGAGTVVHELEGTAELPGAGGRAFVDTVGGRLLLYAHGLPETGAGELYALWAIGPEGPRAAGAFRSDEEGRARFERRDAVRWGDVRALTVTVEQAPGGDQPAGPIVLRSEPR